MSKVNDKYPNIKTVDELFQLENLLKRLNEDGCSKLKIHFMVVSVNQRPHKKGFWAILQFKISSWLLGRIGFFKIYPEID